ncbi:Cell division transporter, ATP-binding protein FtsE (TC 3.A.5.1.1) [hydrothermal vent metagenome]|uniref:Cell division transporter, ATP-binding protein FtsE (TC 3.A.5.1.1) n=1 Tax=hydrothermal vent metagenome TaxID=652676 RepID=A0A3B1DKY7_9ZZZZ
MDNNQKNQMVCFEQIKYSHQANNKKTFKLGPFSLNIEQGELLAILGPSGSGKTTLLRLIAGLAYPNEGVITVDQKIVFDRHTLISPENRQVGMMFQDHALFPHLSVRKNILFGIHKWPKDKQKKRLEELMSLLELEGYLGRYPHELSGGQQQRVALARTLAQNPKVVLLDEPLSNIDADLRMSLAQELRDVLKKTKTTSVWVTHDQTEALDLSDRILVINEGRVEQLDKPWNIYNEPKTRFVADFVGTAVFINGELKDNHIITEIGSIQCPPCLKNSKHLDLMLRPDDIRVTLDETGMGTICKHQFWGSVQLYSVKLPSGQQLLTTQPSHTTWPIGKKVSIVLEPKTVIAFPV